MGKLGRFQKELFTKWGGVTKKNHINSVFQGQPQQLTNLVTQLLAYHKGKTLDTFLSKSLLSILIQMMSTHGLLSVVL